MAGVRSMAFILGSTRTDSTAQPVDGRASPRNVAKRRVMAKDTIRNASVFRPVLDGGTELVPVRRLEGKAEHHLAATCPQDSVVIVASGEWGPFAAGLRRIDRDLGRGAAQNLSRAEPRLSRRGMEGP